MKTYIDDRPTARYRLKVTDKGRVYESGNGPGDCDRYGAREASLFENDGTYYLFSDGAGPDGWIACQAKSRDLENWEKMGPILELGEKDEMDSACVASPWVYREGDRWHMFYLGTPNAGAPPERLPSLPYVSLKAYSDHPEGPWVKEKDKVPFPPVKGSYYQDTSSPGYIIKEGDEYLMYFSAAVDIWNGDKAPYAKRGLGIARTKDLNAPWTPDPEPAIPLEEQVENSSVYYDRDEEMWYLFTNHIGIDEHKEWGLVEYTDSIWVYWSKDPGKWDPENKAVVLDGESCSWADKCIGMPSVLEKDGKLAIMYDSPGGDSIDNNYRHIGLAWAELPLKNSIIMLD